MQFSRMYNNFEKIKEDKENILIITNLLQNDYNEFFGVCSAKKKYITKAFPSNKMVQYQKELQLLQTLEHPNIIRPLSSGHEIVCQLATQFKGKVLVFPEARHRDLMTYITRFGSFSQKVAKFYLKKIVGALIYSEKQVGISHPNLTISNILMQDSRDILLCGWSNSLKTDKQQPSIEIGRLAIQLVTGRDPFSHRDMKKSQFYKFLTEKRINQFWEQIQKSTQNYVKKFILSEKFKSAVGFMLMNKLKTYEEIDNYYPKQEQISLQEVRFQLQEHEKLLAQRKAMYFNKA